MYLSGKSIFEFVHADWGGAKPQRSRLVELNLGEKLYKKILGRFHLLAGFCSDLCVKVERVPVHPLYIGRGMVEGGQAGSVPC